MQDLKYLDENQKPTPGVITTTARKGDKWFKLVKAGDVVNIMIAQSSKVIGRAAVVGVALTDYKTVIERAYDNQVTQRADVKAGALKAEDALAQELKAAYGEPKDDDVYTVVGLLPLND